MKDKEVILLLMSKKLLQKYFMSYWDSSHVLDHAMTRIKSLKCYFFQEDFQI